MAHTAGTGSRVIWWVAGLVGEVALFLSLQRQALHRGAVIAMTTSALYAGGLYVVYLSTSVRWRFE
jgi:hypothetical protein